MRASASLRRGALSALIPLVAVGAPAAGATAEEGVPLKGRVVTPEGSPVPGVRVEILPAPLMLDRFWHQLVGEPPTPVESVETDASGRFEILQPADAFFVIEFRADGFLVWTVLAWTPAEPLVDLPPDLREAVGQVFLLVDAGLPVRVVDPEGRPVGGARVLVHRLVYGGDVVITDEDGRALAPRPTPSGQVPAPVTLSVVPPSDRADLAASSISSVQGHEAVVELAAAAPRILEVRHADGTVAAGVVAILDGSGHDQHPRVFASTGEDGRVEVPQPLSGGPSRLHLVAPDDSWALVELPQLDSPPDPETGSEPLAVTLAPPSVRTILVLTPDGEPMAGVFAFWWPDREARTAADGSLTLRVPRGREATQPHMLMLHAPGYAESFVLDVAFLRGADEPVEIRMTPSAPRR